MRCTLRSIQIQCQSKVSHSLESVSKHLTQLFFFTSPCWTYLETPTSLQALAFLGDCLTLSKTISLPMLSNIPASCCPVFGWVAAVISFWALVLCFRILLWHQNINRLPKSHLKMFTSMIQTTQIFMQRWHTSGSRLFISQSALHDFSLLGPLNSDMPPAQYTCSDFPNVIITLELPF